jgi:hypothetical protein
VVFANNPCTLIQFTLQQCTWAQYLEALGGACDFNDEATSSMACPSQERTCELPQIGKNIIGNTVETIIETFNTIYFASECCARCHYNDRCKAYVWDSSNNYCYLKNVTGPLVDSNTTITGILTNQIVGSTTTGCSVQKNGLDIIGNTISSTAMNSIDDCCVACRGNSACKSYVWNKLEKICHLKSVLGKYWNLYSNLFLWE